MFKSLLLIPSIVLSQTPMDGEYCNWLNSNINTDGEYSLGWADCEQTCIVMARDAGCDIANYGGGDCWCQFGSDQGEDHNDWYHSCFLDEHCDNNGYDCETMECGDDSSSDSGSWSSSSDSEEGHYVNIDGQQYYDYIHLQEFDNSYYNGYGRHTQDFPMHECTCLNDDGTPYCVEPLYSSMSIVEINFYLGYDCSSSSMMMMNQQFHLNTCMEGTLLTGHHNHHDYDPVAAIVSSICSVIFCIAFVFLCRYCCCRPTTLVVNQMAPAQPQLQMVPMQQPQVQMQMVNGQMVPMQQVHMVMQQQPRRDLSVVPPQQLPNYSAGSAPNGEVVQPAYNYPNVNSAAPPSAV